MTNPHVANAFKALAAADPKTDAELLASAQISATLAIAEELRTANLIAMATQAAGQLGYSEEAAINGDIFTRLGLRQDGAA